MPFIQNVSLDDVRLAHHYDPGPNSILIQICDPPGNFPIPKYPFKIVYQYQFLDLEKDDPVDNEEMKCTEHQARDLVNILKHALDKKANVIVHCHAGICRSGAVCEVGIMMGFDPPDTFRQPNLLVKHLMMKELGWNYE